MTTVSELIALLSKFPGDMPVHYRNYETVGDLWGPDDLEVVIEASVWDEPDSWAGCLA